MQSIQHEARCLAMFCKCYQFTVMLLPQSQSIAGRLKQQDAVTSVHDQSPPAPPPREACVIHHPPPGNISGSRPNSGSASCLLQTSSPWHPISSLGYLAGPPLFLREPSACPLEMYHTACLCHLLGSVSLPPSWGRPEMVFYLSLLPQPLSRLRRLMNYIC